VEKKKEENRSGQREFKDVVTTSASDVAGTRGEKRFWEEDGSGCGKKKKIKRRGEAPIGERECQGNESCWGGFGERVSGVRGFGENLFRPRNFEKSRGNRTRRASTSLVGKGGAGGGGGTEAKGAGTDRLKCKENIERDRLKGRNM